MKITLSILLLSSAVLSSALSVAEELQQTVKPQQNPITKEEQTAEPQTKTMAAQKQVVKPQQQSAETQPQIADAGGTPRCPPSPARCRLDSAATNRTIYKFYVDDKPLDLILENGVSELNCNSEALLETASLPQFDRAVFFANVTVAACDVPRGSYADALSALNITLTAIDHLTLSWTVSVEGGGAEAPVGARHLTGLRGLRSLRLAGSHRLWLLDVGGDVLEPLEELREFAAYDVRLFLPLPANNRIEKLTIEGGEPSEAGGVQLGGCEQLRVLNVVHWSVRSVPTDWLAACVRLQAVRLEELPLRELPALFVDVPSLRSLTVRQCTTLRELPSNFFKGALQLRELDLSQNGLVYVTSGIFNSLASLERLDLSGNDFWVCVMAELAPLTALRTLSLANNPLNDFCNVATKSDYVRKHRTTNYTIKVNAEHYSSMRRVMMPRKPNKMTKVNLRSLMEAIAEGLIAMLRLPALSHVDMSATTESRLCDVWRTLPALRTLNYSHNNIAQLTYRDMQLVRSRGWQIDLTGNPVSAIVYNESDYEAVLRDDTPMIGDTRSEIKIDSTLDCDCRSYWYARTVQRRPGHTPLTEAWCKKPKSRARGHGETRELLSRVPTDELMCQLEASACATGCTCYGRVRDNATFADCSAAALERLPRLARLIELRAPTNRIETLYTSDLPNTLSYLNVRFNMLSRVEGEPAALFGADSQRKLLLGGNPIACDCRAVPLLTALQEHRAQVLDYDNVTCADERQISEVDPTMQCLAEYAPVVAGAVALVALLALVVVALYYRHERAIKVFFYARGWCQCWLREEDLDRDKKYDVFVAFAHADEEFVIDVLIPGLERKPYGLNVCVHYRDWIIGDWIPTQIVRSVQESRRTIAVMSRHFLVSTWARAEFRAAHALSLSEGRPRLVLVLLEDINEEKLDDEIRAYLATNTYVKWGDPRFWDKLIYALPHRSRDHAR